MKFSKVCLCSRSLCPVVIGTTFYRSERPKVNLVCDSTITVLVHVGFGEV